MKELLYGVAYYDEYMHEERLEKDIALLKEANINVVRIAESTWSTLEPVKGQYNFYHIDRVLDAMEEAGIYVIIGTPTYAIPSWLANEDKEVLATTRRGKEIYGRRQNMDITNPTYLFYAERIIRVLIEHVAKRKGVIGYQVDNETKHYDSAGAHIQELFKAHLQETFGTVEALNKAFGLAYWSNALGSWEDLPNVLGTINGSLGCEFEKFRREVVTKFLAWQCDLIHEYKREDQFITHNFDFDWSAGWSYGVQPDVDHKAAAKALDIAGVDIYHPSQDDLTGKEIAMGGDIIRSLKKANYLVLETEAQGFKEWLPYRGQLRLQAYSHIASGANMVAYWHWHSLHNAMETYWKGLLSHDFKPNPTYNEAKLIGKEFKALSPQLVNLKKENKVAILVSNEALTALQWFPIDKGLTYNDVFRWLYDSLFELNVEVDILFPDCENLEDYTLVAIPALYSASEALLSKIDQYVAGGGHIFTTFKSGFTNEHVKVYQEEQPYGLTKCLGITYNQFTAPKGVTLHIAGQQVAATHWMELCMPTTAEVLATYGHKYWQNYAALTKNSYGQGSAMYIGCHIPKDALKEVLKDYCNELGITCLKEALEPSVTVRSSINEEGHKVHFYLNYSEEVVAQQYLHEEGINLFTGRSIQKGDKLVLEDWDVAIIEEKQSL